MVLFYRWFFKPLLKVNYLRGSSLLSPSCLCVFFRVKIREIWKVTPGVSYQKTAIRYVYERNKRRTPLTPSPFRTPIVHYFGLGLEFNKAGVPLQVQTSWRTNRNKFIDVSLLNENKGYLFYFLFYVIFFVYSSWTLLHGFLTVLNSTLIMFWFLRVIVKS